jgi:FKBP-type peptidyl-prolyl cis-trans isomerase 2
MTVAAGNQVSIEFTLKLDDGTDVASNVNGESLIITQGEGEIFPVLEEELMGMNVGDTKTVKLEASEAFGEKQADAYQNVPITEIPEDARKPGAMLLINNPDGQQDQVRVHEVNENEVIVDFNHPLAGENLTFEVKIISIQ